MNAENVGLIVAQGHVIHVVVMKPGAVVVKFLVVTVNVTMVTEPVYVLDFVGRLAHW